MRHFRVHGDTGEWSVRASRINTPSREEQQQHAASGSRRGSRVATPSDKPPAAAGSSSTRRRSGALTARTALRVKYAAEATPEQIAAATRIQALQRGRLACQKYPLRKKAAPPVVEVSHRTNAVSSSSHTNSRRNSSSDPFTSARSQ